MALCKFTANWGNGAEVWVNPANVVTVHKSGDFTQIMTVASKGDQVFSVFVREPLEQVVQMLDVADRS